MKPAYTRLTIYTYRCIGINIHFMFCELREAVIDLFFIYFCFMKSGSMFFHFQDLGKCSSGAIGADFKMIDSLDAGQQAGVFYGCIAHRFQTYALPLQQMHA